MVATAAGITTDKMRLLRANLPRSREKIWRTTDGPRKSCRSWCANSNWAER